jgi:hypothetical protein
MSEFTAASLVKDLDMVEYVIESLPDHITTSTHFINWRALFPDETMFLSESSVMIDNFNIDSQTDLDQIIAADCVLGFTATHRIQILKNIEEYWLYNPKSSPILLPEKDKSFFANQVRSLIKKDHENALVTCMVNGYTELFDYIYERDSGYINKNGKLDTGVLIHYAVSNGHIEMIERCIKMGLQITSNLIQAAMDNGDPDIFRMLFTKNQILINYARNDIICEQASLDIFRIFLEFYINNEKDPANLIFHAIKNINNLKELLINYDHLFKKEIDTKFLYELFRKCHSQAVNIDVFLFIEAHFGVTLKELIKNSNNFDLNVIECNVILNENLEVYNYLRESGFEVNEISLRTAIRQRTHRITPGLIRSHLVLDDNQ